MVSKKINLVKKIYIWKKKDTLYVENQEENECMWKI